MQKFGVHCYDNLNILIDSFYYQNKDDTIGKIRCMAEVLPRVMMTDSDDYIILEIVNHEIVFPIIS